ncbi:MAG: TIGR01212 family radical SAM protein [wastewater metagenome]|nr:TIGR01212 family radical SAM protein [Candidatus Loosdrechtia aerotolerans]
MIISRIPVTLLVMRNAEVPFQQKPYLRKYRFFPFREYLKEQFPYKVYKIPLHAGFTCPNRDGRAGTGGCTYCINESFSPNVKGPYFSIKEQIEKGKEFHRKRYGAEKFIAYFQSFTNTYADIDTLRSYYEEALSDKDVIGISIGTRPDCVTDDILNLINTYTHKYHVWIEYGLQSIHDTTLRRVNRGHNYKVFLDAIHRTKKTCIHICVHVILGLPGETRNDMMETAGAIARLGIQGIKLHHLYVAKNTVLAKEYFEGRIQTMDVNTYTKLTVDFLERIPSDVTVQRLVGDTHGDFLISPTWKASKASITSGITREFEYRNTYQGFLCNKNGPGLTPEAYEDHGTLSPGKDKPGQDSEKLKLSTIEI